MISDCFISINIISKHGEVNNILNAGGVPIIFYWDGESDMINDITSNENFNNIIKTYVLNKDMYDKTYLSMIYINGNDFNNTKKIQIQSLYKLDDSSEFALTYIKDIIFELYKFVFKKEYILNDDIENIDIENIIKEIFLKIKEENKDKISDDIIIHYILSKLNKYTNLNTENKQYLIDKLKNIVKES